MSILSTLIGNLVEHPVIELKEGGKGTGVAGTGPKKPGPVAMVPHNNASRVHAFTRYIEALKEKPLTAQELAAKLRLKNARTMLMKMTREGYVRNIVPDAKRAPKQQKVWVYTGKPAPIIETKRGPYK
jgi:hypothetical protein